MMNNKAWTCNKCGSTEKMMMNGLCVIHYMAKHKLDKDDK